MIPLDSYFTSAPRRMQRIFGRRHLTIFNMLIYARKPVICIETGERFSSQQAAESAKGLAAATVGKSIRRGGKAGGLHWKYPEVASTL